MQIRWKMLCAVVTAVLVAGDAHAAGQYSFSPTSYGIQASSGMQLGCVPPVDMYPTGQLQDQLPAEPEQVPLPQGSLAIPHPLTHVNPLEMNPVSHVQLYPIAGAT